MSSYLLNHQRNRSNSFGSKRETADSMALSAKLSDHPFMVKIQNGGQNKHKMANLRHFPTSDEDETGLNRLGDLNSITIDGKFHEKFLSLDMSSGDHMGLWSWTPKLKIVKL